MRLVGRHDLLLLGGLGFALAVAFLRPISPFLDYVRSVERGIGLQLVPALLILAGVFIYHQLRKRVEARAQAAAAATEAQAANARANEMERLVAFGHALAEALDADAIRAAVMDHLPAIAPSRASWIMIRDGDDWQTFAEVGDVPPIEARAASSAGVHTFSMSAGRTFLGVLGVGAIPVLGADERRTLEAAAALLAVSIKNAELFRVIRENSVRDSLTGCFNRAHTLEVLDAELRRARRSRLAFALIIFDIDHFKQVNDRYGHLGGDAVLRTVGRRMHEVLRGSDVKCRYGGEEFLILLPDTPLAGAVRVADTLRRELEAQTVPWNGATVSFTASFGVTSAAPGEIDAEAVIGRADAALYRAKEAGRNRVETDAIST
jgi:diguanylate cyclase (GGDEF)-like protein